MFGKQDSSFFLISRYRQSIGVSLELNGNDIAESLRRLMVKHFQKYAFHSLSFNLKDNDSLENKDRPFLLNRNALINQLIRDCGGSCYHHNSAFQMVLEANEIESWFVSCLVRNPREPEESFAMATHVALVFNYEGTSYLFDPGWDGTSFSIYSLPLVAGEVIRDNNYQVRKTDNPDFPFTFEEIKENGTIVPRYDFSNIPTQLANYHAAIAYLNSRDYAFNTLFLFTRINNEGQIIRFVNRQLIIQDINGQVFFNEKLAEDTSIIEKLTELFGEQEGLMEKLSTEDFKNPDLGQMVCQKMTPILRPNDL